MSYEVVYTSSPRGLKNGDRGFCTVAATSGIPRLLNEKLETLSGYRHAFPAASDFNPVNYSYLVVQIQRERYYVLSRVSDAGNDYTGRSNKIAHHLALSAADVRKASAAPDVLLSDAAFWITSWDGKPRLLPNGRMPSPHESPAGRCRTWKKVFGDSGWAGLLARAVHYDMDPVWVIVPPGTASLALVTEAMHLVSPEKRWRVCFSTYYTQLLSGYECRWRFLLDGTDEARALRARPSGILVDPLQSQEELPDDDPFVAAARSGDTSVIHANSEPGETSVRSSENFSRRPVTPSQARRRRAAARARQRRLAARTRPVQRPEETAPPPPTPVENLPSRRGKRFWWIIAAGILAAGIVVFFVVRFVLFPPETASLQQQRPTGKQWTQHAHRETGQSGHAAPEESIICTRRSPAFSEKPGFSLSG